MFSIDTKVPGLYLVLVDPRYSEEVFSVIDENRQFLRTWLPWLDSTLSATDSENFLRSSLHAYSAQTQFSTMVFSGDEFIGMVGLNRIDHANYMAEIGYWLSEKYNGKGYMSAAVEKLVEVSFERYDLNRLVIRAATGNKPSQNLAKRLNFIHEGTERQSGSLYEKFVDHEVFSLLKNEWDDLRGQAKKK